MIRKIQVIKLKALIFPKERNDPGIIRISSLVSYILVALSGLVLYLDKVFLHFDIQFGMLQKFEAIGMDFSFYIWLISQTISPLLLLTALAIRWFNIILIIPFYCYFLQLYFVFKDHRIVDDNYLEWYAIGSSLLSLLVIWYFRKLLMIRLQRDMKIAKSKIKSYGQKYYHK
ncbi:hypothetical protein D1013_09320 [Euzebyella marina]|uniref:Uncharacterized protein n=2 Tax=Euzebyella marina TaxID=1761453 RepID=A0A3G2L5P6_9FLAO|nr:hypothetical protein D1013_09320 [Euzebyella marina]